MMDKPGMAILMVNTESPAWHAGLKMGDIILEVDGEKVNNINDYYGAIAKKGKGERELKILRSGEEIMIKVSF